MGEPRCGLQEIRDSISVWRVCSILATLPIFWTLYDQQFSAWVLQAKSMNLHGFVQPEQLGVLDPLLVLVLLPLMQNYIYPRWRGSQLFQKFPPTHLKRIGIGMVLATLAFVLSAFVQFAIDSRTGENKVSVFVQIPQFAVMALAEILVSITAMEFAYLHAPEGMKATCQSLYLMSTAVGDLLGAGLYANLGSILSAGGIFLMCAFLMLLNAGIFALVSRAFVPYNANAGNGQSNRDEDNNQHGEAAANAQPASSVFQM